MYKPWKGKFYPKDLPDRQMQSHCGEHFGTVEINNTFYRLPAASAVRGWAAEVGVEFRFAPKAPQQITHQQRLRDADETMARFFEVARSLGNRLGPVLFQLPPNFPKDLPRLRAFLKLLSRRRGSHLRGRSMCLSPPILPTLRLTPGSGHFGT